MRYNVEFLTSGNAPGREQYGDCKDAGMAFAQCQKDHPNCKMVRATAMSGTPPYNATMEHEYPSPMQRPHVEEPRPARAPTADERDGVMPFYDEVLRQ